ncbi:hypothetical protein M1M27_gp22 [Cellulophaga phage Ingeline_1]|uniref:Uncharacterized protein n=1 Tax=Cellulophaga phage Ingeline_1 TaxID=2745674 RepID=A0A8E5EAJ6_9CAUD|nr:hypothetical protein M1M27_gp22 [Cellulophaga phage Ingeline_1]QQV90016.1 hypothetical protein Ingeline2_29 [Cellulophaga phage Ingeline_2]QQV90066.1 hypothetical protein Ingeline3_29 [Cellulophaga phage Ingeline_3]QQV90116.1 hypothetical protein Ingeline4_29 [Cellulophaga phage Ingeline_4]QQV90166.1 hypothetical protein Ingeline5_29 [Cellulophaga phage Ingeline_5]QQV90215.1 hypothetical protein Ingeline6_29 [Cellulophaga phage Ingeline_6]QQV90265.1 hypothetical protein Ingeline7_29 [Cellu
MNRDFTTPSLFLALIFFILLAVISELIFKSLKKQHINLNTINEIETGLSIDYYELKPGNIVRVWHIDDIEPKGGFWWYAKVVCFKNNNYLKQLDFNYTNTPEDIFTAASFKNYKIELLS